MAQAFTLCPSAANLSPLMEKVIDWQRGLKIKYTDLLIYSSIARIIVQ